jgi:hypothetical protein
MKRRKYAEFWYALVVGVTTCVLSVPVLIACQRIVNDHSHDAILGWGVGVVAMSLLLLAASCVGWEILLLKKRELWAGASELLPLAVLISGLLALVLATGLVVRV